MDQARGQPWQQVTQLLAGHTGIWTLKISAYCGKFQTAVSKWFSCVYITIQASFIVFPISLILPCASTQCTSVSVLIIPHNCPISFLLGKIPFLKAVSAILYLLLSHRKDVHKDFQTYNLTELFGYFSQRQKSTPFAPGWSSSQIPRPPFRTWEC